MDSTTLKSINDQATIDGIKSAFEKFQRTGIINALEPCQWNYFDYLSSEGLLSLTDDDMAQAEDRVMRKLKAKQMLRERYYGNYNISDVLKGVIPIPETDVNGYAKQIALKRYFEQIKVMDGENWFNCLDK